LTQFDFQNTQENMGSHPLSLWLMMLLRQKYRFLYWEN